jgi:hypothetical protein
VKRAIVAMMRRPRSQICLRVLQHILKSVRAGAAHVVNFVARAADKFRARARTAGNAVAAAS